MNGLVGVTYRWVRLNEWVVGSDKWVGGIDEWVGGNYKWV